MQCPSPRSKKVPTARTGVPCSGIRQGAQVVYTSPASARKGGRGADSTSLGLVQEDRDLDTRACSTGEGSGSQLRPIISGEEDLRNDKAPKWAAQRAFCLHFGITDQSFGSQIAQHPTKPLQEG